MKLREGPLTDLVQNDKLLLPALLFMPVNCIIIIVLAIAGLTGTTAGTTDNIQVWVTMSIIILANICLWLPLKRMGYFLKRRRELGV